MSDEQPHQSLTNVRKVLILLTLVSATTTFQGALLVASTLLPQMKGAMGATEDEIAWVMTYNILATAVVMPMTGWLVGWFGRRAVTITATFGFVIATALCGVSDSLSELVIWRVAQGAFGSPLIPMSQTILLDTFPRHQHRFVQASLGIAGVLGPVLGPTLGGVLAEYYSWRWAFYMLVPIGTMAGVAMFFVLPKDRAREHRGLDWYGFISLSVAISCVQLVLSRGQRLDWFDSTEIWCETILGCLAFYFFIVHSLTTERPFLNPKLLLNRNYAIGLLLVGIFGMLNVTPIVLLPSLLQQHAGFPDSIVGFIIGFRGLGALLGFLSAIWIGKLDPKFGMSLGFGLMVVSGLWMVTINLNVGMYELAFNSAVQGFAVGTIWVPLALSSFGSVGARDLPDATSVFHLVRNIGSSFFIAVCVAEIVRTTGANYSRLTEMISPYSRPLTTPDLLGGWSIESAEGLAALAKEILRQASLIGYLNGFWLYTLASALAIPLVMLARRAQTGAR